MHSSAPLEFHTFGASDPLSQLEQTNQVLYVRSYLADLGATSIVLEPHYFDRDYLSEFSKFYSTSSRGYPNVCKRLHFFKEVAVDRNLFIAAAEGQQAATSQLNDNYLGFCVIRPITATPLGRTVLKWYDDKYPNSKRVTEKREYRCHIAGVQLRVEGLAWQQQDTGVGACATIALWSALHSLAFDEFHSIPTTTEITEAAHLTASLGTRIYPSKGLTVFQLCEAIKELGLSPIVQTGELANQLFSKERFMSSVAAYVRSGYPVIAIGNLGTVGLHAICIVGFRENQPTQQNPSIVLQDAEAEVIYLHDDNLGPNVRCKLFIKPVGGTTGNQVANVCFKPEAPQVAYATKSIQLPDPTANYPEFSPTTLVVAVHNDLRTSPENLLQVGILSANAIFNALAAILAQQQKPPASLNLSTRFIKLKDYIDDELERLLNTNPTVLGKTRLSLWETVPPMSLHLGVVRIGSANTPLLDIIFDTTDSDRNLPVFAHVVYDQGFLPIVGFLTSRNLVKFGTLIQAF